MKFVCERCHTKYSIADEKVRGKVLKVRCKTCTNVITVRETGATIEDHVADPPRAQPVLPGGSFDSDGDGDTMVAPRAAVLGKLASLPAAALFEPSAPIAASPPVRRKGSAPPPLPGDDIDWYLAVDGAQTGPFSRSRLLDKILGTDKDADVHVWNADFDGWKAPSEVADLQPELARRRRSMTPVPPPPVRRRSTTGGVRTVGAGAAGGAGGGVASSIGEQIANHVGGHLGPGGFDEGGLAALDSGRQVAVKVPATGQKKTNGVAAVASPAVGSGTGRVFGDLLGTEGSAPVGAQAPLVHVGTAPELPLGSTQAATVVPRRSSSAVEIIGAVGKNKQLKLVVGAAGVAMVLCTIVAVWLFRRPAGPGTPGAAAGDQARKPAATQDFGVLAEQLKKEETQAQADKPPEQPAEIPAATPVDPKPVVARLEPATRATKGKQSRRKNQMVAPPRFAQAPVPPGAGGLTAEQRDASRLGESTGRDVRVPAMAGGAARTTPNQGDISRVINNNRQGIQTCYQRALLRDNTLTHGKVTVRVSIGLSGKVKSVNLDAPAQFRALEPCIRDVMSRWAFPPSSEEYGTEFPVVLQGNQ